jgi:hypothetical protein
VCHVAKAKKKNTELHSKDGSPSMEITNSAILIGLPLSVQTIQLVKKFLLLL